MRVEGVEAQSVSCTRAGADKVCLGSTSRLVRKALIKELAVAYHAECAARCKELLQLQRKVGGGLYPVLLQDFRINCNSHGFLLHLQS